MATDFIPTGDPAYHCVTCGTKWYRDDGKLHVVWPKNKAYRLCRGTMVRYVRPPPSPLDAADEQALRDPHD